MFCACAKMHLFSVVFSAHKFDFGFVISGTSNKCRLVFVTKKIASCMCLTGSVRLPPTVVAIVKELPTLSKPNALSNGLYPRYALYRSKTPQL